MSHGEDSSGRGPGKSTATAEAVERLVRDGHQVLLASPPGAEASQLEAKLYDLRIRLAELLHTARELGLEVTERPGGGWGARNARADRQRETYREALEHLHGLVRLWDEDVADHEHEWVLDDAMGLARAFLDAHPLPQVLEVERRQEAEAQAQAARVARLEAALRGLLPAAEWARGGERNHHDWPAKELAIQDAALEAARAALEDGR